MSLRAGSPIMLFCMILSLSDGRRIQPETPATAFNAGVVASKGHRVQSDAVNGRAAPLTMAAPNAPAVYNGKYADELRATAAAMVRPGYGLLACDESTGTVGTRLESIGLENNEDNRRTWRNLLFTTPDLGKYISGAILFEETLFQNDPDGKPFVDVLKANGIIPGIKVDTGLKPLCGGLPSETWCSGLDELLPRCQKFYEQGAASPSGARRCAST